MKKLIVTTVIASLALAFDRFDGLRAQEPPQLELMSDYPANGGIRVTRDNRHQPAFNQWYFQNSRQLFPTANISRGDGPISGMPRAPHSFDPAAITFQDVAGQPMSLPELIAQTATDSMLVLHKGQIVYERYFHSEPAALHDIMSISKSITGLVVATLAERGRLQTDTEITEIIPELTGSHYEGATVQHLLDMTAGVYFKEDESGAGSAAARYAISIGHRQAPLNYDGPTTLAEFLFDIGKDGDHGRQLHYVTPNTDLLAWILFRVTGKPLAPNVSELLWAPMGAERDAYVLVAHDGAQIAGFGMSASLRDLARLGLLVLNDGQIDGRQIIPRSVPQDLKRGGDPELLAANPAFAALKGFSYHNQWIATNNKHEAIMAWGSYQQFLYVDPASEMVIVKFSSLPTANHVNDMNIFLAFHEIGVMLRDL